MTTVDQLIKAIDPKDNKGLLHGHYIFDPDNQELRDKQPLFGTLPTYAVIAATTRASGALGPILIPGTGAGNWLEIFVDYQAWVEPANIIELFRACTGTLVGRQREAPGALLVAAFTRIVQAVARRDPSAFDQRDRRPIEAMQREIAAVLLRTCGLHSVIILRTGEELAMPPIVTSVTAYARDFPSPLQLRVTMETFVWEREKLQAKVALGQRPPRYLEGLVDQTTRDVVGELPTMQLRYDPHGLVTQQLRTKLEEVLGACFIRVRAIRVELTQKPPPPPPGYEGDLAIELSVVGHPKPVPVSMHLHLQLSDEGVYWSAGGPALDEWLKVEAKRAVTRALQGATYSQLCLETQRFETLIRGALQVVSRAIGYEVVADISLPRNPASFCRSPYLLELSGVFNTAISEVTTHLDLALQVQLSSLEGVRALIDQGVNVEHTFTQATLDEVAAYLHTVPPGHLFTYFNQLPPITSAPGEIVEEAPTATIQSILHKRVAQTLLQKFNLRTLSFQAKLGASALRDVHDALLRCSAIKFSVSAKLHDHLTPVPHFGALEVKAIRAADWMTFQRRQPSIQQVSEAATLAMSTLLDRLSGSQQFGLTPEDIRELAYHRLPDELRRLLGLTVTCVAWSRELGKDDLDKQEHLAELRAIHLRNQRESYERSQQKIFQLMERRQSAILDDDFQEAEQITRQIKQLQSHSFDSGASAARPAAPAGPREFIDVDEASS